MSAQKRPREGSEGEVVERENGDISPAKQMRSESGAAPAMAQQLVKARVNEAGEEVTPDWQQYAALKRAGAVHRTSSLKAPIMLLEGHDAAVYSVCFASTRSHALASGSHDRRALLWSLSGNCESFLELEHPSPVLEVHWSVDSTTLLTCSPDKTARLWDPEEGALALELRAHRGIVNSCCTGGLQAPHLALSASDDCSVCVWDLRSGERVQQLQERYPVISTCFSEGCGTVFAGGIEECVRAWDLRQASQSLVLHGHADTITGMQLSPDGRSLLTNSADCTLGQWNVEPMAVELRHEKAYIGHAHNFERNALRCAWSPDGKRVTAGSSDRNVYVWNAETAKMQYKLPGHAGSVNEATFHPKEPVIASASSDHTIFLGELDS
jgi:Prp8 binding protein